jgi:hypothetical protein
VTAPYSSFHVYTGEEQVAFWCRSLGGVLHWVHEGNFDVAIRWGEALRKQYALTIETIERESKSTTKPWAPTSKHLEDR